MAHYFLNITLEITLQKTVRLVEHEKLTMIEESVVFFYEILESTRGTDHHLDVSLFDFVVVFLDHSPPDKEFNVCLVEFADFLGQCLHLQRQLSRRHHNHALNIL